VLAGQKLGIKEVEEGIWLISFMSYDLGYIDLEQRTLQTICNAQRELALKGYSGIKWEYPVFGGFLPNCPV
jgi:hypothetical protein